MRGASRVAIALPAGLEFAVALHACLLAGAAAVPVDLREPIPRRGRRASIVDRRAAPRARRAGRRRAVAARRAAPPDAGPRRPHLRHDRRRRGRSCSRSARSSTTRSGCAVALGHDRARALALPAAAQPRRRADGAAALGDLRHDRGARARPTATTSRSPRSSRPSSGGCSTAPPPAVAARRDARRRARRPDAARRAPATPAGRSRRPTGSRRRARRSRSPRSGTPRPPGSRCPGVAVVDRRRRRDRRRRPDRRRSACTPATSAGSTSAAA